MKSTLGIVIFCLSATALAAQVDGYVRKDGTYVAPHMRSNPNSSRMDNYSTQGNMNPYTGQMGSVNPYNAPQMAPQPNPYANPYSNPYNSPYRP